MDFFVIWHQLRSGELLQKKLFIPEEKELYWGWFLGNKHTTRHLIQLNLVCKKHNFQKITPDYYQSDFKLDLALQITTV
jgi:transcription termination factor Rho